MTGKPPTALGIPESRLFCLPRGWWAESGLIRAGGGATAPAGATLAPNLSVIPFVGGGGSPELDPTLHLPLREPPGDREGL